MTFCAFSFSLVFFKKQLPANLREGAAVCCRLALWQHRAACGMLASTDTHTHTGASAIGRAGLARRSSWVTRACHHDHIKKKTHMIPEVCLLCGGDTRVFKWGELMFRRQVYSLLFSHSSLASGRAFSLFLFNLWRLSLFQSPVKTQRTGNYSLEPICQNGDKYCRVFLFFFLCVFFPPYSLENARIRASCLNEKTLNLKCLSLGSFKGRRTVSWF